MVDLDFHPVMMVVVVEVEVVEETGPVDSSFLAFLHF